MNVWDITRLVRRGGHLLSESTWEYWPTNGNNEIAERNISLQLAVAFAGAGFHGYAEGHSGESTSRRTDLLLLHPEQRVAVVTECKRLYSAEKCGELLHDLERILAFAPRDQEVDEFKRFGVLAATTWDDGIARWWSSRDRQPPTKHCEWDTMRNHSSLQKAHWGSVVLLGFEENSQADARFHYMLYTVFETRPSV